jgi:sec-independent protein translocase protein TatC
MAVRPIGHEDRLSLVEHLDELRSRLIACVVVFVAAFGFTYWQNDEILEIVNRPLEQTQNLRGEKRSNDPLEQSARFQLQLGAALRSLEPVLRSLEGVEGADAAAVRRAAEAVKAAAAETPTNTKRQPVTLGVAEPFTTTFTVAMWAALLIALPFLLFQAYAFVLPAFTAAERRIALPLMALVPVLFIAGVLFGYFVALPRAVDFLQNFNDDDFDILLQARDYYRFNVLFLGMIGILFQIPVGVLLVTRLGVVSTRTLRKNRGYVILGLAVAAAVATPTPDPVTMTLALAPLVILFELSVQLARLVERDSSKPWWAEDDDDDLEPEPDVSDDAADTEDALS